MPQRLLEIITTTSPEGKLLPVDESDLDAAPAGQLPGLPGRNFSKQKGPPFKELLKKEDAISHALILHHFANHELQAIELAALALLKFRDAPQAYRLELLQLLQDEQKHLSLYMEQMAGSGIQLGAIQGSMHFWNSLARASGLTAFICGLNLTFEQANLDHALFYLREFRRRHDRPSANIMYRILKDEINHVRHGLCWFERLTALPVTLKSYADNLPAGLSPVRARGNVFSRAVRLRAGFSINLSQEFELFSDSRGRQPTLTFFNAPGPVASSLIVEQDLGLCLSFAVGRDDSLILPKPASKEHRIRLLEYGFELPALVSRFEESRCPGGFFFFSLDERAAGLALQAARFFNSDALKMQAQELQQQVVLRQKIGKRSYLLRLNHWLRTTPEKNFQRAIGHTNIKMFFKQNIDRPVVLKPEDSASGQGFLFFRKGQSAAIPDTHQVAEAWVNRRADYSLLFAIQKGTLKILGTTQFFTGPRGRYHGCLLNHYLHPGKEPAQLFRLMQERIQKISRHLIARGIEGPGGMDGFLYQDEEQVSLQPCSEINLRYTFGHLALALRRKVRPSDSAVLWILPAKQAKQRQGPIARSRAGKLGHGLFFLSDPDCARRFALCLSVAASPFEAFRNLGVDPGLHYSGA